MAEFRVVKPFRETSSRPMHLVGDVVDSDSFDADFFARLVGLGLVEDVALSTVEQGNADESHEVSDAESDSDDVPVEDPDTSDYPALPKKAAPVAEWEEYARRNDIKLTGLKTRNAKIGYITKVVAGS